MLDPGNEINIYISTQIHDWLVQELARCHDRYKVSTQPYVFSIYKIGGRNQLLDGSISLSPLYPAPTIDLHVRIATVLHQGFPWLQPGQA